MNLHDHLTQISSTTIEHLYVALYITATFNKGGVNCQISQLNDTIAFWYNTDTRCL